MQARSMKEVPATGRSGQEQGSPSLFKTFNPHFLGKGAFRHTATGESAHTIRSWQPSGHTHRVACTPAVVCKAEKRVQVSQPLFDRTRELNNLKEWVNKPPHKILVLVGPQNCGKSAVVKRFLEELQPDSGTLPGYIDGRAQKLEDPAVMADVLRESGANSAEALVRKVAGVSNNPLWKAATGLLGSITAKGSVGGEDVSLSLEKGARVVEALFRQPNQTINSVIEAYNQLFAVYAKARQSGRGPAAPYLVVALDEANVLCEWQLGNAQQQSDLRALLRHFVRVSKQEQTAHVILVTSDYGFQSWLRKEIGVQFYVAHVIGDFAELEAKAFFTEHALPAMRGVVGKIDVDVASWKAVYKVCGGNAGLLLSAAAASESEWASGLRDVWRPIMDRVWGGLQSPSGWTTQQYSTAMKQLLAAPYHAVSAVDLVKALGADGEAVLDSMVKANLMGYRPESAWACDVPVEAFNAISSNLVAAPSAAHLHCMRLLEEQGMLVQSQTTS